MDAIALDRHLRTDGEALSGAARGALDRPIPGCPGWDMAGLVEHLGRIHRWATTMVRTHATDRLDRDNMPGPPTGEDAVLAWFDEGLRELVATLHDAGEDSPVWNWSAEPDRSSFWHRRMAHETAVHRWDGESVATAPNPIDPELAADGIDELLSVFVPRLAEWSRDPVDIGGSIWVHSVDVPGDWQVRLAGRAWEMERGSTSGDAGVRGDASDVLLFLYNRVPADRIEVTGDVSIVRRWTEGVRW